MQTLLTLLSDDGWANARHAVAALDSEAFATPESLRAALADTNAKQLRYLSDLPFSAADQRIRCLNFRGQTWEYTLRQMVRHLVLHAAHHRPISSSSWTSWGAMAVDPA